MTGMTHHTNQFATLFQLVKNHKENH